MIWVWSPGIQLYLGIYSSLLHDGIFQVPRLVSRKVRTDRIYLYKNVRGLALLFLSLVDFTSYVLPLPGQHHYTS
jgi:hypothetical protein